MLKAELFIESAVMIEDIPAMQTTKRKSEGLKRARDRDRAQVLERWHSRQPERFTKWCSALTLRLPHYKVCCWCSSSFYIAYGERF